MRRRGRNTIKITLPKNLFTIVGLFSVLGFIVFKIPPKTIQIVFLGFLVISILIYYLLQPFMLKRNAILVSIALGSGGFLYALDMLDLVNTTIWLSLLLSISIFANQK